MHKDIGFVAQDSDTLEFVASYNAEKRTRFLTLAKVWQSYADAWDDLRGREDASDLRVIPVEMQASEVS